MAREDDARSRLLQRRTLLATGPLDAASLERVTAELLVLDATGPEPVELRMMGRDGDLDAALALAATIDLVGVEVRAHAMGTLGGSALAPFAAAAHRLAAPSAMFVLADPVAGLSVERNLPLRAAQFEHQRSTLHRRLAAACGIGVDRIEADMRRGRVMDADEAMAYGLVETVVQPRP